MSQLGFLRKSTGRGSLNKKRQLEVIDHPIPNKDEDWNLQEQPLGYTETLRRVVQEGQEDTDSNWIISYADLMTLLCGFFIMLMSFSKIDSEVYDKARKETTKFFGGEYTSTLQKAKAEAQANIQSMNLGEQIHLDLDAKGVTVTFRGSLFFETGSADLRPEAVELIRKVLPVIKESGPESTVVVEGHTDDNPIKDSRFPSNWELSSYRASSVLRFLEELGFPKSRLRAIGFGDTIPAFPNRDKSGKPIPENQSQNRRVVLRIIKNPKQ